MRTWRRTWAEISIDNLRFNYNQIRARVKGSAEVCCVVKANGYGHNALRVARELSALGASWFAVSNIEEALQLRRGGINASILILGYTPADCAPLLADNDISQCVYSYEYGKSLAERNCTDKKIKVHIKADTGMGRIGVSAIDVDSSVAADEIERLCTLSGLEPQGLFTHFALSDGGDDGRDYTELQYSRFCELIEELEKKGIDFKYKHCANTAAALDYPELQMDMVRVGIALYGLHPSESLKNPPDLRPVMSLKSVVSFVKKVKKGTSLSYGCEYVTPRDMTIATVPIGYADGFFRTNYSGGGKVIIGSETADIVGRVCMDQMMVDVSHIEKISIGDEVIIFGDKEITADTLAHTNKTINYEIICAVGERVPRVFTENGEITDVASAVFKV